MNLSLRFFLLPALIFFLACRQNSQVQMPPAEDCGLTEEFYSDTSQITEFLNGFARRDSSFAPVVKLRADSVYCFRVEGGWGFFDYLATVYADSGKYYAQFSGWNIDFYRIGIDRSVADKIRPLTPLEWTSIRQHFYASNFWCNPFEEDGSACVDCTMFYLWAREGKRYRLVRWGDGQTKMAKPKALASVLGQVCGFPEYEGVASYQRLGDSIRFAIYPMGFPNIDEGFTYSYNGKPLPKKDGYAQLTLPQKDFEQVYKVIITETKPDGTIRRFTVERLLGGD
ncbi:MAG: hypothetical protein KDD14_08325 [Saprospiraceae bacterium]|nr:hypothetical protein [Saprospiraceae bacterium]